jgi:hypothetical protein
VKKSIKVLIYKRKPVDSIFKNLFNIVGSFIWTHLNNLATTSLPSKLEIQGLILDHAMIDKFDTDARKFSRNYEKSILLDQYNAGRKMIQSKCRSH